SGGVPQASKRTGSRAGGGGVAKPPNPKSNGAAKANGNGNGNGAVRSGPVDPRTEDTSAPQGISRGPKTIWRRPGASTKHHDIVEPAPPADFAMTLPLAPAPFAIPAAKAGEPVADITKEVEPPLSQPTIE